MSDVDFSPEGTPPRSRSKAAERACLFEAAQQQQQLSELLEADEVPPELAEGFERWARVASWVDGVHPSAGGGTPQSVPPSLGQQLSQADPSSPPILANTHATRQAAASEDAAPDCAGADAHVAVPATLSGSSVAGASARNAQAAAPHGRSNNTQPALCSAQIDDGIAAHQQRTDDSPAVRNRKVRPCVFPLQIVGLLPALLPWHQCVSRCSRPHQQHHVYPDKLHPSSVIRIFCETTLLADHCHL